ncbi:DUF6141 family protein [Anaeroselena agilis]|uniref:DUF6141 family protein n=1 Tax=Anaeroselena agilis TaxID=3063788 RepID=A0ABU3P4N4_9FIRM|nr:DUF6141 family protein [Selenomonadales bacterium 4137-cl]
MSEPAGAIFREEQRFRQLWLWLVVAATAGITWYGFVGQVFMGRPFGDRPASDGALTVIWLLFGIGLPVFFRLLRLVTVVSPAGVHFRFAPFHFSFRALPPADIRSYEARTYRPLLEYGGWGIRSGRGGDAYNVSGDRGVQFVLAGGRRVLIGTQRPEEFVAALDKVLGYSKTTGAQRADSQNDPDR